jgi:hypothetical protein
MASVRRSDGRTREIGRSRDGFTVDRVSVLHVANGVQLDVAMRLTDVGIAVTRHFDEARTDPFFYGVEGLSFGFG